MLYVILQSIYIILDIYVIGSFIRYIRSKGWSTWIIYLLVFTSVFMTMLSSYAFHERLEGSVSSGEQHYIFMIVMVWYIPKVVIMPFLLISHITSGIKRLLNRKKKLSIEEIRERNSKAISNEEDVSPQAVANQEDSNSPVEEIEEPNAIESEDSSKEKQKDIFETQDSNANKFSDKHKRREFIRNVGWSLAGVPFVITGYGALKTLYDFEVKNISIPIKDLPRQLEGIRIAQLSDLHLGSFPDNKPFQEAVRIFNSLNADISVVTGDFVNFDPIEIKPHFDTLNSIKGDIGTFSCMGNHDHYMSDKNHIVLNKAILAAGIDEVKNENRIISIDGAKLNLMGVDNTGMNQHFADFDKSYNDVIEGEPVVLMCHDPRNWDDTVRKKYKDIDLMMAGHTHGGQFAVELMGMELQPVSLFYKRYAGLYKEGDQYLYVNRGTGTTGPPIRIGVNPEITVFTLTRA